MKKQVPLSEPRCEICGITLSSENGSCTRCRNRSYAFETHRPVFAYEGDIKRLIALYKFQARKELAFFFARVLHEQYMRNYEGMVIIPAPSRPASKRARGWDQVAVIADILQTVYRLPVLHILTRKAGKSQKSLDYEGRIGNLRGKILARHTLPSGIKAVILDDVFTTGATIHECAAVTRRQGAHRVDALTLTIDI